MIFSNTFRLNLKLYAHFFDGICTLINILIFVMGFNNI